MFITIYEIYFIIQWDRIQEVKRRVDYQTLSQYIVKINQHKDIDGLLLEVSRCLKDILDYELFGFALKRENYMDLGDEVLKEIAMLIPSLIRKSDWLARFGGEEFILVLPNTPLYNGVKLAEKIRKAIKEHAIATDKTPITVTVSFGVASLENKSDAHNLLLEADARLYHAKAIGKNRVIPSLLPCFGDKNFVSKASLRKHTTSAQVA